MFRPREGVAVELLVDGAEALPRIASRDRVRPLARASPAGTSRPDSARATGPDAARAPRRRGRARRRARARVGRRAPAALPSRPRRGAFDARQLVAGTRIEALDARERPMHCHHEKLVDRRRRVAFVGGIDLTSFAGDRLDSHDAPGPRRARLARRVRSARRPRRRRRRRALPAALARGDRRTGSPPPGAPPPAAASRRSSCAPCPSRSTTRLPKGEFSILESYLRALRAARAARLPREPVPLVAGDRRRPRGEAPPATVRRLPPPRPAARPAEQRRRRHARPARRPARRRQGAAATARFLACTLYQPGRGGRPVYVHAKIGIVDDRWLTIGSANLNEHSLFNDTEMNVVVARPGARARRAATALVGAPRAPRRRSTATRRALFDELWTPARRGALRAAKARRLGDGKADAAPARVPPSSKRIWGPLNGFVVRRLEPEAIPAGPQTRARSGLSGRGDERLHARARRRTALVRPRMRPLRRSGEAAASLA